MFMSEDMEHAFPFLVVLGVGVAMLVVIGGLFVIY